MDEAPLEEKLHWQAWHSKFCYFPLNFYHNNWKAQPNIPYLMIRDRLKNLFEAQCVKGACVEEDYACSIVMVLLSRSKNCSFMTSLRQNSRIFMVLGGLTGFWALCLGWFHKLSFYSMFVNSFTNLLLFSSIFLRYPIKHGRSIRSFSWHMCSGVQWEVSLWAN